MSKYCNECKTTRPDAKYCPECGSELETPPSREGSETKTAKETGSCEKCDSQISLEADRCPECGYEPANHGAILSIIAVLSVGVAVLLVGLILLVWVVAIATNFPLSDALFLTGFLALFILPSAIIGYLLSNKERQTPTGRTKSWSELWEES